MNGRRAKKLRKELRKELQLKLGEELNEHDNDLKNRVEIEVVKKQRQWMNLLPVKLRFQMAWRMLRGKL